MPTDYKIPLNTTVESQDVAEGKPVVKNLDSDTVDGYHAPDFLTAGTMSAGSGLYMTVVNYAKNNVSLDFPACPVGFDPVLQDGFVQYQNQSNVVGGQYSGSTMGYRPRVILDGQYIPLQFQLYKNTATTACYILAREYFANTYFDLTPACVGDCSSCTDAASIAVTYTICERDPTSATFQGGEVSAPSISSLTVERLISDIPYKGRLQINSIIDNGGENVDLDLYIDDVLIDEETLTNNYSYLYELAPESHTSNIRIVVTNGAGSDQTDKNVWVGAIGGGMYTEADCTSAGGTVYTIQSGVRVCRFVQADWTCPSGWSAYFNWSTTSPYTGCCTSSSHAWTNTGRESCICYNYLGYYAGTGYAVPVERGCY
jgi:hypothetical protein